MICDLRDLPDAVQRRVDGQIKKRHAEEVKAAAEAKLRKARRQAKRQKRAFLAGKKVQHEELRLTTELIERVVAELTQAEADVDVAERQTKQLGTPRDGDEKKFEPYYAYGGCKRCLELADEIGRRFCRKFLFTS